MNKESKPHINHMRNGNERFRTSAPVMAYPVSNWTPLTTWVRSHTVAVLSATYRHYYVAIGRQKNNFYY